jgi:putative PIN family toxin of toxin-antitoxin system
MIYAVIDTNVLVSALLSRSEFSATCIVIDKMLDGLITPVYNEEIIREYNEVLRRPKFKFSESKVEMLIDYVVSVGISSVRTPYNDDMTDEKDRVFYEVSLSNEKSFLVTGNLKHFPTTPKVVSPAEMVSIMDSPC